MEKHTPGPWFYRPNKYDDWGFVRAAPPDGETLGHIVAIGKDTSIPFDDYDKFRAAKADPFEANARLIAAAPDMLAELQRCLETLEVLGDLPSMQESIRTTISKALSGDKQ